LSAGLAYSGKGKIDSQDTGKRAIVGRAPHLSLLPPPYPADLPSGRNVVASRIVTDVTQLIELSPRFSRNLPTGAANRPVR